ncbi:MAG TPA: helix-turn-helix domain-containing protein [Flavobacteriaceae bacterium]|nr:helix-turn-helix domain-containing protein [Flavobacteriaceae bacterium]
MLIDDVVNTHFYSIFEKELRKEICSIGVLKHAEPDKILLEIRRDINFVPFIISGVAKVMRRDGQGNGFFLHYLTENQTSAIAINYAIENVKSEIRIKSESDISYIAVPSKVVNLWHKKYSSWQKYYSNLYQKQTSLLLEKINDIAFTNLENRLLKYLEETSIVKNNNILYCKHFDIARDLKVSREAVSRVLKKLENDEILTLGRNKIVLS